MSELKYTATQMNNVLSSSQEYYRNWKEAEKINKELRARISELSQAVGLITTLKPTMVMDAEHPLDMAKEAAEYVTARISELEESDKHWAGNVKVCMQLIERYESDIAELEEIDRMRSESVSTLNQANANNEDEIELLEKRIAKLKAENETLKTACDILRKQNQRLFAQVFSDGKPELNVCKACGGDGTVLLTDGYEGQVIATAKCIYCNGTGRVNKESEE